MTKLKYGLVSVPVAVTVLLVSASAHAAGFALQEQSVKGSGRAFAGEVAMADDASVMFYNPAGLTQLSGPQAYAGAYAIIPSAKLSDAGSSMTVGPYPAMPVGGLSGEQGFSAQPAGYLYGAAPVADGLWAGIAVTVPFGLKNNYKPDYFGRYNSTKSTFIAVDIAPTLAYRLNNQVSIGGSVNIQRANATLANALPNPLAPGGPSPASDGLFTAKASDWSVGFTAGILFQAAPDLRVGVSYRSKVKHTLKGDATTEFAGMTTVQGVTADVTLPDIISAGLAYQATPDVTLMAQFNYYGWSSFKEVRLKFEDGTEAATTEDFKNVWGASVGAEVKATEDWTLRGGLEYDKTPTRDAYRSTRIPDADRIWAALGATYRLSDAVSVDLSYVHMFVKSEPINRTNAFPLLATTVETVATTRTSSNVLGIGLRGSF